MNRLRGLTIGAALLAGLTLALFAYLLADAQSDDREEVENRFKDVAEVSAAVTNGIFASSLQATQMRAAEDFAGPIEQRTLDAVAEQGRLVYAAILDERGRRIAATEDTPAPGEAVEVARESGDAQLSDVMGSGQSAVIEWAIPYETASGRRILVQGIPITSFADFLAASLGRLPNFGDAETLMVDSQGVVLGGAHLSSPVAEPLEDTELLDALEEEASGNYGDERYFASGDITGSPFKIVLDTSKSDLYESISGRTLSWILFAAFALVSLAGLYLLRRTAVTAAELQRRELNERHAVEINDNIIQGLALAKYQLQAGENTASAEQVSETLREAQRLVSGLLGDAEVQAGQLRREIAAETKRPEPPPAEAPP